MDSRTMLGRLLGAAVLLLFLLQSTQSVHIKVSPWPTWSWHYLPCQFRESDLLVIVSQNQDLQRDVR